MVAGVSKEDRKRILCPEYKTEKKQPWWDWRVVVKEANEVFYCDKQVEKKAVTVLNCMLKGPWR